MAKNPFFDEMLFRSANADRFLRSDDQLFEERERRRSWREFETSMIKKSSVKLSDGGDTHFHPWQDGRGITVTTRLPGGLAFHDDVEELPSLLRGSLSERMGSIRRGDPLR